LIKIDKIKQKTVVEQVMEKIKELIASGQYNVNDRIPTESELAEMFGIGRSSIREAIKIFNYLGILESHTAKGTFVCDRTNISTEALTWSILLGKNEFYDLVEFRGAIELWSLINLTERYKENPDSITDTLKTLAYEIENMRDAIEAKDIDKLIKADYDFHSTILQGSENSVFQSVYLVLKSFMLEEIKKVYLDYEDLSTLIEKHQKIISAIKTGDVIIAIDKYREHIKNTKTHLERVTKVPASKKK